MQALGGVLAVALTRLIEFGRFAAARRARRGLGKPETFKFLGLTFICERSRHGRFALKRKSRGDRMRMKLKEIKEELRRRRHQPVPEQGKWLRQVVSGFFEDKQSGTQHVPAPRYRPLAALAPAATQPKRSDHLEPD